MGHFSKEKKHTIDAFLKENCNLTWNDIAIKYNKQFNMNATSESLRMYAKRNNIYHNNHIITDKCRASYEARKIINGGKSRVFTLEQINWLKDNVKKYFFDELLVEFNKKFNTHLTSAKKLGWWCRKLLGLGNGKHYNPLEDYNLNYRNVGNVSTINGVEYIKVDNKPDTWKQYLSVCTNPNWKRKVIFEYERLYKDTVDEKTETVIHLNGNKFDYSKSNLRKIKRSILYPLMFKGCLGLGEYGITQAYIECLETERLIKDIEEK